MRYVVAVLITVLALIVACGGSGPDGGEPSPTATASPTPVPTQPPLVFADETEACRFYLPPSKPNDPAHLSIVVHDDYLCWESSPGAAEYVVELSYAYTNCGGASRTQEIAETHPAGAVWTRLLESPFNEYPFLHKIIADVAARDAHGMTIGEGRVVSNIGVTRSELCESPPPSPTPIPVGETPHGAWSDCPAVVSADLEAGLHVLDAESCVVRRIAETPDAYGMSWSPNGVYLAFLRNQLDVYPVNSTGAESDLFLARADGSQVFQLTNSPGTRETSPIWSPDGSKLAYGVVPESDPLGGYDLIVHDLGNGDRARIAPDIPCLRSYRWVPTGDQIILSAGCGDDEPYVALVDLESGETSVVPGVQSVLAVQPNGDLAAFGCNPNDPEILYGRGLCIGRLDGSELSLPLTLAAFPWRDTDSSMLYDPIVAYDAEWTRDGSQLAILSSKQRGLFLLPAGGAPGTTVDSWPYEFLYWAASGVIVTSTCKSIEAIPCGPYVLTSYRTDTNETWEALIFNCGSAGGVWSPDGSQLVIGTAQLGGCL